MVKLSVYDCEDYSGSDSDFDTAIDTSDYSYSDTRYHFMIDEVPVCIESSWSSSTKKSLIQDDETFEYGPASETTKNVEEYYQGLRIDEVYYGLFKAKDYGDDFDHHGWVNKNAFKDVPEEDFNWLYTLAANAEINKEYEVELPDSIMKALDIARKDREEELKIIQDRKEKIREQENEKEKAAPVKKCYNKFLETPKNEIYKGQFEIVETNFNP